MLYFAFGRGGSPLTHCRKIAAGGISNALSTTREILQI
jgi:hypothetical protein